MKTQQSTPAAEIKGLWNTQKFDIEGKLFDTGGKYDACGKCGAWLDTYTLEDATRDKMADSIKEFIIDPFALLVSLLVEAGKDVKGNGLVHMDGGEAFKAAGRLLGLAVSGAYYEMKVQRIGACGAYVDQGWLEEHEKQMSMGDA